MKSLKKSISSILILGAVSSLFAGWNSNYLFTGSGDADITNAVFTHNNGGTVASGEATIDNILANNLTWGVNGKTASELTYKPEKEVSLQRLMMAENATLVFDGANTVIKMSANNSSAEPTQPDQTRSLVFWENGAIAVRNGATLDMSNPETGVGVVGTSTTNAKISSERGANIIFNASNWYWSARNNNSKFDMIADAGTFSGSLRANTSVNLTAKNGATFNFDLLGLTANASLTIEGSKNTLNVNELTFKGYYGTAGNAEGNSNESSTINFVADANGFSTLYADSITGDFAGVFNIDFSNLVGEYNSEKFILISSNGDWSSDYDTIVDLDSRFDFKFRKEGESAELSYEDGNMYVTFTSYVPEPSTYAVIFGAIALAFVAYRKKRA